jgi:two-component sensor histidine kinase
MDNAQLYSAAQLEIAQRTRAEQALRAKQADIESLNERLRRAMQETHHRVKNNLQIMAAMIDMQLGANPETVRIDELHRLSTHVRTLAGIHDVLTHQSRDGQSDHLSARAVMDGLLEMLRATVLGRNITAVVDDVALPTQQCTSLALVVNELVSNALKHGEGAIDLRLCAAAGNLVLEVADEGPGFPQDFDPEVAAHTGLELVVSVSRWDLRGEVAFANRPEGGAVVSVTFPLPGVAAVTVTSGHAVPVVL